MVNECECKDELLELQKIYTKRLDDLKNQLSCAMNAYMYQMKTMVSYDEQIQELENKLELLKEKLSDE